MVEYVDRRSRTYDSIECDITNTKSSNVEYYGQDMHIGDTVYVLGLQSGQYAN